MKKWMYNLLIAFFAAVLVISAAYLAYYYIDAYRQHSRYDDLAGMMESDVTTPRPTIDEEASSSTTAPAPTLVQVTDPETGETVSLLPEFAELYTLNNDIVGWMTIPGTDINYPVMQTPDSPDYYLKRNFDKETSSRGCLYAREVCDVFAPSDNITIYGHRMRDGSMFARLDKYMEQSYCEENPYIYFDTLTGLHTYKIMAVFLTTASVGEGFAYHEFVNAQDASGFEDFVKTCKELALYDTGVTAEYGDKLITLSTCEYSQTNGRLVVVAKRIA